jgi:hypothetical protein
MRQLLVDYLNNPNDGNKFALFLVEWFHHLSPDRPMDEIHHIVNRYIAHLQATPHMFDSRYIDYFYWTLDMAKSELGVVSVLDKEEKVIKNY